jgi:Mrp family chromosome partitioning ATPase/capsular polysaccharide biosynthesis protein
LTTRATASPLERTGEAGAVRPLLRAIQAHRSFVVATMLAALGGALVFLALRTPTYEATAHILVNPLPQDDQTFIGLDLLRESGDPTRTVQTAATLLESTVAAEQTARALGGDWTADKVTDSISVEPLGESNIVGITGTDDEAATSAELADEFADNTLEVRSEELTRAIEGAITRAEAELETLPSNSPSAAVLSDRLSSLRAIEETGDPTLSFQQPATIPGSPTGAGAIIIIPLVLIAGFALGSGGALLLDLVSRRIGDADEALALYPMPVLARIPTLSRRELRPLPGTKWYMPPQILQQYQSLVVQLEQRQGLSRVLMVTSASKDDGKTTAAINLAVSLAATGKAVALLDCDFRHPRVAEALDITETRALSEIAQPGKDIEDLLVRPVKEWPLYVLPSHLDPESGETQWVDFAMRRQAGLIQAARSVADCVVVDTPPLGVVSDALRLLPNVDGILVVVRVGGTIRSEFKVMGELLDRSGYEAEGCVLLDEATSTTPYGYGAYQYGVGTELVLGDDTGNGPGRAWPADGVEVPAPRSRQ